MVSPATRHAALAVLCLWALLLTLPLQAADNAPPAHPSPFGAPPTGWPFRPPAPSDARGQPPTYQPGVPPGGAQPGYPNYPNYPNYPGTYPGAFPGGYPGGPPGSPPGGSPWPPAQPTPWSTPYGSRPGAPQARPQPAAAPAIEARPPRLELEVASRQPYLMENVLVRVRLISDTELAEATPEPPGSDAVLWQRLEEPKTRLRTIDGRREIVTELVLILTPLRAGDLEVPPIRISGAHAARPGQSGQRFAVASDPIALQVRPALASVSPWLPLTDLSLKGSLDGPARVKPGQPVQLILELDATGATGDQLPSLEPQLRAADLRVYREQTLTSATLSRDGEALEGQRTEYYTLIPQTGGRLHLPEIELAWWNVATDSREVATMPIRTLGIDGRPATGGLGGDADWASYWLPVGGLALLLIGYWTGMWYRGRLDRRRARAEGAPRRRLGPWREGLAATARRHLGNRLAGQLGELRQRLDPRPALAHLRSRLGRTLPPNLRLALAIRAAERAPTPADWHARLQRHLDGLEPATHRPPPRRLADRLLPICPAARRAELTALLGELDGALYAGQALDFPHWKRRFRRTIGRAGSGPRFRVPLRRATLPPLNPPVAP
ncbi:BatD family protein [Thiococcus pfennigii]|uniref:BatD family protein n=1 Tax=Thiococcus pfennigii TaxID=1057 RepID=UPI0019050DF3|nr:BatD family protein [Thiococcus pfennigii]MBK1732048.1 hypothetical protein [Thiococcus pfennigii]